MLTQDPRRLPHYWANHKGAVTPLIRIVLVTQRVETRGCGIRHYRSSFPTKFRMLTL